MMSEKQLYEKFYFLQQQKTVQTSVVSESPCFLRLVTSTVITNVDNTRILKFPRYGKNWSLAVCPVDDKQVVLLAVADDNDSLQRIYDCEETLLPVDIGETEKFIDHLIYSIIRK